MKKHIFFFLAIFATCTLGFGQNITRDEVLNFQEKYPSSTVLFSAEQQSMAVPVNLQYSTKNAFPINSTRLTPKVSPTVYNNLAKTVRHLKKGRWALVGTVFVWMCATEE